MFSSLCRRQLEQELETGTMTVCLDPGGPGRPALAVVLGVVLGVLPGRSAHSLPFQCSPVVSTEFPVLGIESLSAEGFP